MIQGHSTTQAMWEQYNCTVAMLKPSSVQPYTPPHTITVKPYTLHPPHHQCPTLHLSPSHTISAQPYTSLPPTPSVPNLTPLSLPHHQCPTLHLPPPTPSVPNLTPLSHIQPPPPLWYAGGSTHPLLVEVLIVLPLLPDGSAHLG